MSNTRDIESILENLRGKPVPMARFAQLMRVKGNHQLAYELSQQAAALAPDDAEVRAITSELLSHDVPDWHFSMLKDSARNAAYETALIRAITPGCRVLEIGTGSGLLAMMAARAGAGEVVSCEVNPTIANIAKEIIALNGYSDRVRIAQKHSDDLELGVDISGSADVLVSEIFGADLLSEGAIPALEKAKRRLLSPNARIVPARGKIRIALADNLNQRRTPLTTVNGFDVSPFNRLSRPAYFVSVGSEDLVLRSDGTDLFGFDFQSEQTFPHQAATRALEASGGRVSGVVQWIRVEMADGSYYENQPGAGSQSHWGALFYPFIRPLEPLKGNMVTVCATHDRLRLRMWTGSL